MANFDEFNSQQAIQSLISKGAKKFTCPLCGGRDFSVQNQVATIGVSSNPREASLGRYTPSVMMICTNCGLISFFSLSFLDKSLLMGKKNNEEQENQ